MLHAYPAQRQDQQTTDPPCTEVSVLGLLYMHIPLKDRTSKLPTRRAQRCRFLAYSYTIILVPTYVVIIVHDNNTYGGTRVSKDIIFDESCVFNEYIDNSPTDEEFAARHHIKNTCPKQASGTPPIEDLVHASQGQPNIPNSLPPLELYEPGEYLDLVADLPSQEELPAPLIVADPSEFQERINEW